MQLTFLGGAETVTGSKFLVEVGGTRVLIDCGLFQGLKMLRLRNWERLPVDPRTIDAVLLTHAHIDHSGYLPRLVTEGFGGPIYCTSGTAALARLLLPDAGHIQEEDARHAARRGYSRHKTPKPLYTEGQAVAALAQLQPVAWDDHVRIGPITASFHRAGHILGAASVRLQTATTSALFSGDLGRPDDLLMPAPEVPTEPVDHLVVESTYGLRTHPAEDPLEDLHAVVERTIERGGTVLIPSFAVGRTQTVLYGLYSLIQAGRLPADLPIFINSPLAIEATELYLDHIDDHKLDREQTRAMCRSATLVRTVEESKALHQRPEPKVILSASGMLAGGRVLHHLRHLAPDPKNTLLFCGFQASGTRGAAILGGADEIRVHGRDVPIRCEVARMDAWSAHADHKEILDWLRRWPAPPQQVFVVHGEPEAADAMRGHISRKLGWSVSVPRLDESLHLAPPRYTVGATAPRTQRVPVDAELWERTLQVAPLALVGTLDPDGAHNLAPKHMVTPVSFGPWLAFSCAPDHTTWKNAVRTGTFTVSFLRPRQVLDATLASGPRDEDGGKPTLAGIAVCPAEEIEGIWVDGARLALECALDRVVEGLGDNGLLIGRIVAAHVAEGALRSPDRDDEELLRDEPLLVYVHPLRFGVLDQSRELPVHLSFRR